MSKYLELVEVSEGVVVLRRSDQKDAPLVKIEFSSEVKTLLNGMEFDVAKEMIKSGIETLTAISIWMHLMMMSLILSSKKI